jgi:spore germination protein PF
MPFVAGPITINNVGGSATVEFGDSGFIAPKFASKTYHGSGSSNTGAQVNTVSIISLSNTIQSDLIDQPMVKDF